MVGREFPKECLCGEIAGFSSSETPYIPVGFQKHLRVLKNMTMEADPEV